MNRRATILLCGGYSRRMGAPKALLPIGGETMLEHMIRRVRPATETIVVVAAEGQSLPPLPREVRVARDRRPDRGPLEGLAVGLAMLGDTIDAAFLTGCDTPALKPEWITLLFDRLAGHEMAVPEVDGQLEPLAAVYAARLLPRVEAMLVGTSRAAGPSALCAHGDAVRVPASELRRVDRELESLRNVNTPEDYRALLARLGLTVPAVDGHASFAPPEN